MHAHRASHCFDGTGFVPGGATVLVQDGRIRGVEPFGFEAPDGCDVTTYDGTLLPGLVDVHTHLVTDSGFNALDRVAGRSAEQLEAVITEGLRRHLAAGVTTVRDLGDRDYAVVERRDRGAAEVSEPRIVAFGPPVTSPGGHCHYLGGVVSGPEGVRAAVQERAGRGADGVKVMASGGMNTPGSDVMTTQFSDEELRLLVDEAHAAGLPVTAHAHGTPAVRQSLMARVDGIEHCSCVTDRGFGDADDALVAALADSGVAVCPTLGLDLSGMPTAPPPSIQVMLDRLGTTFEKMVRDRDAFVARLFGAGVRIVSGVDSGIQPPKAHGTLPFAVADLLRAGLTITQALVTATSGAAAACGLDGVTGRLIQGYAADLLVVDGDLGQDMAALHRPLAVVRAGSPVPR